jgi:hypothetical protein
MALGGGMLELTEEEKEEIRQKYNVHWFYFFSVESLDIAFNNKFSKNAVNIIPVYKEFANEDGLLGVSTFGRTGGYDLILKEQIIGDEKVELYFYFFYDDVFGIYKDVITIYNENNKVVALTYDCLVGRRDWVKDTTDDYIFYEDSFDTLNIVKYTFILEDGKYKIFSIENVR